MKQSEEILIEKVRSGDREAQRRLYTAYAARLLSVSVRYVVRRDVAEDILHDAFIKIFNSISTFKYRGEGSLRAWMERIVVNTSLEWLRVNNRLNIIPLSDDGRESEDVLEPSYEDAGRIPHDKLLELIGELPDGYRSVFNLFCVEGLSHREIAQQLNINEKSSSSQLLRAKRALAKKIKEYIDE